MQKNHKNLSVIGLKILIPVILFSLTPLLANAGFSIRNDHPTIPKSSGYDFTMQPGDKQSSTVTVGNTGSNPIDITFYGSDAFSSGDIPFTAKGLNEQQYAVGKWLVFNPNTITIQPGEKKEVPFTIQVPQNTPPGVYAGAVAASTRANNSNTTGNAMGVTTMARTILPVFISIPGTQSYAYQWKDFTFTGNDQPYFYLTFTNKGNTIISISGSISVYNNGTKNKSVDTIQIEKALIYKGESIQIKEPFDKSLASNVLNSFNAVANIHINKYDVATGQYTNPDSLTKEISFSLNNTFVLYLAGVILIIILLAIIGIMIKKYIIKKNATRYTVQTNDTLDSICKKTGSNWKTVVSLNKIKPPYGLKAGKVILIPKSHKK